MDEGAPRPSHPVRVRRNARLHAARTARRHSNRSAALVRAVAGGLRWTRVVCRVIQGHEDRTSRVMRLGAMLRAGWTPSALLQAGFGLGYCWRDVHMQGRVG